MITYLASEGENGIPVSHNLHDATSSPKLQSCRFMRQKQELRNGGKKFPGESGGESNCTCTFVAAVPWGRGVDTRPPNGRSNGRNLPRPSAAALSPSRRIPHPVRSSDYPQTWTSIFIFYTDLYIHLLYVLVSKIFSSILNSYAHIHHLYHPLSTLFTVGPTCHFI
jgi:hypothetical protein